MVQFKDKVVLITGGTGSLGKTLVHRLLKTECAKIIIFSRDEAKQFYFRTELQEKSQANEQIIYKDFEQRVRFFIGDVRNLNQVKTALQGVDIVINAAALKQVPSCEYFPFEAEQTNVLGAQNVVQAIIDGKLPIETVVGVSTDKACKPINVMGMTKALQERIFIAANIYYPQTRFICVRYGNVLASRGSVIPYFHQQIHKGGPVTLTTEDMTRFLLPLEKAVDIVFQALEDALPGETYIPKVPAAKMIDVAHVLIGNRDIPVTVIGIRPGEKVHEIMISYEEAWRTREKGDYYSIASMLPELMKQHKGPAALQDEYSSSQNTLSREHVYKLLHEQNLLIEQNQGVSGELLR